MSTNVDYLQLEKLITCELWYTAHVVHRTKSKNDISNDNNIAKLCLLISCFNYSKRSSWIIHKLLAMLTNNEVKEGLLNLIQFEKAIHLIDRNVTESVEQELLKLYEAVTTVKEESDELSINLSESTLKFLENNFEQSPALVHWIIDQLLCIWSPKFAKTDSDLQDLYKNAIISLLQNVSSSTSPSKDCQTRILFPIDVNVPLGSLLCILSKFDITEAKEKELTSWLWPALLTIDKFEDIALALYSRKNLHCFKMWHEFLDDINSRNKSADNLNNALSIRSAIFDIQDSRLHLNSYEILTRMLKNKSHWLSDTLDICYTLTINDRLDDVAKTLDNPWFDGLWLPLLFKCLKNCLDLKYITSSDVWKKSSTISSSLRFILEHCKFESREDPVMMKVKDTLESHLNAWDWIIKSRNSLENKLEQSINQHLNPIQVFHHLQEHSILSTIKTMVPDIHNIPFEEIFPLLKDSDNSRKTYQAYTALLSALKAILLCNCYNTKFECVTANFNDMEKYINNLYPINLRLEVLENIFSMIFLRYEHFSANENTADCDADDEDTSNQKLPSSLQKNSGQYHTGFVCNKYAIREILHHLKRCIFIVDDEYKKFKADSDTAEDLDPLQQKIVALKTYCNEATWRLELIISQEFTKKQGLPDAEQKNNAQCLKSNYFIYQKVESNLYKVDDSSSNEADSRSDIEISSESSMGNTNDSGKRRKRLKTSKFHGSSDSKDGKKPMDLTLNNMLSSKETLVLRCLWKDDFVEAQRVIKTFNMENNHLAGEISFSDALRKFRQEIGKQISFKLNKKEVNMESKHSTLDFIRKAAEDGIQTTRITSQVETFLTSQEPNIILSSNSSNTKDILTLVIVDLALTMGHDNPTSENLSEIAIKHLKSNKKLLNTQYHKFFETIYQLFYEKKNSSIYEILCDARIPLSLKEYRDQNEYWNNFQQKLKLLEEQFKFIATVDNKDNEEDTKINMDEVLSICNNGELYLHRLNAHLDLIRSIAPSFEDMNTTTQLKPFLLENSIDSYIGYQIFDMNMDLESLEIIANQLQVNLAYCILSNCCPKLLCGGNTNMDQSKNNRWGIIVLNKYDKNDYITDHINDPNQFVIDLVSELNQALQDCILHSIHTDIDLKAISKNENITNILNKSSYLINCDLSYLSCGRHTLVFFLNVWNLMMLHTILEVWSKDPPINDLHHAVSCSTIGYLIGDLGFVTLFTLRSKLLGQSLCDYGSLGFEYSEELNEPAWQDLDLQQDPRVIFAMINEYQRSPVMKIYQLDTLNEDLNVAAHDYLYHYCNQNRVNTNIRPKLIEKYKELLNNAEDTKLNLENNLNADANIEYESFQYLYDIRWKYSEEKTVGDKFDGNDYGNSLVRRNRIIKSNILQYLEGHCWLLSYLIQRIYEENPTIHDSSYDNLDRMAILENLFKSPWAENLKCLFGDNSVIAGLQNFSSTSELWQYFEILMKNQQYDKCLIILNSLPDSLLLVNAEIQSFRDKVLTCLICNEETSSTMKVLQYLYQIKDIHVLTQIVLSKVKTWPARICEKALRHILSHVDSNDLPTHCRLKMSEILCRVLVFDKMLIYCKLENDAELNWYNLVYKTEKTDPIKIIKSLIDANQYELCLEWMEYQTPSLEIQSLVSEDLFIGLLKNEKDNFKHARKLLMALPVGLLIKLCKGVIGRLESMNALKFVIQYLVENSPTEREKYQKTYLGVEILDQLDTWDRPWYNHLINEPLLILEQLLMNCKFDNLQKILMNSSDHFSLANFSVEDFDKIIRFYAQKSLDFKGVNVQRDIEGKIKDTSLNNSGELTAPIKILPREDWVPDEQAKECSCCKTVIFSMFNRRHHCRRCGRVVCASCSAQKMKIPVNDHSIFVRVCNDCQNQAQGISSISTNESFEYWKLTNDYTHNKILREEFCFEYAPNISLCLAILNLHSDHKITASFLLDQCEIMKDLLTPDKNGRVNSEVDHELIIQMIRTLLVAAKFKYAELGLNSGLTECDKFLSQVDLIATLVRSDCLSLIPKEHINDHTFRRLRDLLTEKEQWRLALDVSTKSGLQTQGVWAAWGKACLKVGYYESAREKFAYCLDKVYQEDCEVYQGWILLPHSEDLSRSLDSSQDDESTDKNKKREMKKKTKETLKSRPSKDPPLLQEILQILEVSNFDDQYSQQSASPKSAAAQEILNTLNNLKAISQGQYTTSKSNSTLRNFRYQESLYYLLMYGSYNSILEFFVRYGELEKCLSYILRNDIDAELFFNAVFLGCLKNGSMTQLFDEMKAKDPTLLIWKKYLIFTCHNLEKKQLLNTLYQLQLFMKDYVRAAMTCIRFYVMDASSYADICLRNHFLLNAQKHLEAELKGESFEKSRKKSVSSLSHGGQTSLTMEMEPSEIDKHINTISRQMEIAKFLGACEKEGRSVNELLSRLSFMDGEGLQPRNVPTLFGNQQERTYLAVLAILCGINVEEGFGIAFRVMQDYNLRFQKVCSLVGQILVYDKKIHSIEQLIKCCRSSGAPNSNVISDRVLTHCIKNLINSSKNKVDSVFKDQINHLITLITDVELKIGCFIESKQLKAAYLLAVKYSRAQDIQKILKEADSLGQAAIKSICTKWLQQNS
ncbi:uncharacterized protein Sptz [Chelonus insularis]|uniref:uncharacterized protein Sptz n=1 Tax=Chelonus insularis TaxID=460826 RepID=UPI00158DCF12|nr:uncharacterized protein LOC118067412 [Chelonus insularis]